MKKNVFVIGLDDHNTEILKTLRRVKSGDIKIRQLLEYEETHGAAEYPIEDMLQKAVSGINDFPGPIDAITAFWDFPVSCMVPVLCAKYGLPSASLESVLMCEHKYWSRTEQKKVIPEHIPGFQSFDPFDDDALEKLKQSLNYPFWIKPIKSFGSHLGFRIRNAKDWQQAIPVIRGNIGTFTDPLDYVMDLAEVPAQIADNKDICIAEEIIGGRQCTLEGYVYNGRVKVYGVVDSIRYAKMPSFSRYQYPSHLPKAAQKEMIEITGKLMRHIGYDNRAFNVEFFYDMKKGHPWLLEVNTRMAQSHADLFYKVDGASSHEIMADLSLGQEPDFPHRDGDYGCAGKFFVRTFRDGTVSRVPSEEKIAEAKARFPGLIVQPMVHEGMALSQLLYQDSYSYYLAILYMGGKNERDLMKKYQECVDFLDFQVTGTGHDAETRQLSNPAFPVEASISDQP